MPSLYSSVDPAEAHPSPSRLTSALTLVLVGVAIVVYDATTFRRGLARDLELLADVIGGNSTAALDLRGAAAATGAAIACRAA